MKTRTAATPISAATPKKTPPARKPSARAKQLKKNQNTPPMTEKPEQRSGEEGEATPGSVEVTPTTARAGRVTKSFARRTPAKMRTRSSEKGGASQMPEPEESLVLGKTEESKEVVGVSEVVEGIEEHCQHSAEKTQESAVEEVQDVEVEEPVVENVGKSSMKEPEISSCGHVGDTAEQGKSCVVESSVILKNEASDGGTGKDEHKVEKVEEELTDGGDKEQLDVGSSKMEENVKEGLQGEVSEPVKEFDGDEGVEYGEKLDLGENEDEELRENDTDEPAEETKALEEEQRELTAIVKERKNRKEREVFVGGLDRDAVEEDVRKVFQKMGEIVEIRLHKSPLTNKNKGYAFVEYAKKEHAERALSEMKNPVIHGKRCGTAPSEDNDTLFLGNICNTWTKEAINQKLKEYGVEGVENITLVPDLQREGLSRGFAFIEFSCHADAMFAYKRLQKPDVIFGHLERTAKVAFAEPLREPDPNIMAQVKSVFVDGLPPHWDEDRVREQFKGYGEIIRICLARNMSTAKREDFGFVDFSTHEAAVACIDGINNSEFADGNSKIKVKARLSNPLPKTQAVKGGMSGGFRIGRGDGGFPKFGRGFGRARNPFNNARFPRDIPRNRGFYHGGRGQMGRSGFLNEHGFDNPYPDFHGRQFVGRGGRRGAFRGGHYPGSGVSGPNVDRPWHGPPDRERGMHYPARRQPYSPERFEIPFPGSHFDDSYLYGDSMHGMKRPLYMRDPDPDYVEPSRIRPRLDYPDPASSFQGNRYHDNYGSGNNLYSSDFYGPDYAGGPYSSFYGGDQPPFRRGYYF